LGLHVYKLKQNKMFVKKKEFRQYNNIFIHIYIYITLIIFYIKLIL